MRNESRKIYCKSCKKPHYKPGRYRMNSCGICKKEICDFMESVRFLESRPKALPILAYIPTHEFFYLCSGCFKNIRNPNYRLEWVPKGHARENSYE